MKAERRHELQENSLAHILTNFPLYLSIYGGRILLVLSLLVLGVVLFNWRNQQKLQQQETAASNLASAREAIDQLGQLTGAFNDPVTVAQQRTIIYNNVGMALDNAVATAEDPTIKAECEVVRGDLYWTLANLPELPGAATQPALALTEKRDELLAKSRQAYQNVTSQYSSVKPSRATALFGLAAIAENEAKFDDAKKYYEEVSNAGLGATYKTMADMRLQLLPIISKPRRIVEAAAIKPATMPVPFIENAPIEAAPTTAPATSPSK